MSIQDPTIKPYLNSTLNLTNKSNKLRIALWHGMLQCTFQSIPQVIWLRPYCTSGLFKESSKIKYMENGVYIQHIAKFDSAVSKPNLQIIKKNATETNVTSYRIISVTNYHLVSKDLTPQRMTTGWINLGNALTPLLGPFCLLSL
jgi:hypothetical protein